jgi:hypothetical protein
MAVTYSLSFDVEHDYARSETIKVVVRRGWLDRLRLGLIEYESKLYVSRYDD